MGKENRPLSQGAGFHRLAESEFQLAGMRAPVLAYVFEFAEAHSNVGTNKDALADEVTECSHLNISNKILRAIGAYSPERWYYIQVLYKTAVRDRGVLSPPCPRPRDALTSWAFLFGD